VTHLEPSSSFPESTMGTTMSTTLSASTSNDLRENGVAAVMFCLREVMKAAAARWQAQGDGATFVMASPIDAILRRASAELLLRRSGDFNLSLVSASVQRSRWTRRRLLFVCDEEGAWCWQGCHVDVVVVVVESIMAMESSMKQRPPVLPVLAERRLARS
jgi:hypothetical protein